MVGCGIGGLGVLDFAVGNARAVIDRHVHILPTSATGCADAASSDAVADTLKAPELLDIEMKQVAGVLMLIALRRWLDLQCTQAIESIALKDPAHGCPGDAHVHGDAIHGPALSAPRNDLPHDPLRCPAWLTLRARRSLVYPLVAVSPVALRPALNRLWVNMEAFRCLAIAQPLIDDGTNHPGSASRRQRGIVMTVHGGLLHWVAKSANSASLGAPPWTTY